MNIEDAIQLIRSKYEDNKTKKWIKKPVAYTLYEVWKITDTEVVLSPSAKDTNVPTTYDLLYEEGGYNSNGV